jgi:hypothetical protein
MAHRQHHLEAFILLLVVALLVALGFALFTERRARQDSGAAERPSCRSVQYARGAAPLGSGHPGGALPSSERMV